MRELVQGMAEQRDATIHEWISKGLVLHLGCETARLFHFRVPRSLGTSSCAVLRRDQATLACASTSAM